MNRKRHDVARDFPAMRRTMRLHLTAARAFRSALSAPRFARTRVSFIRFTFLLGGGR